MQGFTMLFDIDYIRASHYCSCMMTNLWLRTQTQDYGTL